MCFLPPGKLAALSARGPAGKGIQETQIKIINYISTVGDCTDNDDIVLRAVDPAQAYHDAGYISKWGGYKLHG